MRRSSGQRRSVVEEILRAQARHRPWWWATPAMTLLLLAGCASSRAVPDRAPGAAAAPTATVTGYIQPCAGLPFRQRTSTGAWLFSAAATVQALRGQEHQKPMGDGISRIVWPTVIAAQERVSQNQKFRLDHLAPGRYVILAHYVPGNVTTSLGVLAAAGQMITIELPNTCK